MRRPDEPQRRAARLLVLYPRAWRERYGEEFAELLAADLAERPRSWSRMLDLVRGGLVARMACAGWCPGAADPARRARASLATLGCCAAVVIAPGAAMWSQLTVGWQWSAPKTGATAVATVVLSLDLLGLLVLGALAAIPVLATLASALLRTGRRRLVAPAALLLAGAAAGVAGGRHFANGWPGTGGHPWAHRDLVPAGLAAFSWASTLSLSSYWAHPAALLGFPRAELAWMALSPLAAAALVAGAVTAVLRLELPAPVLRFEARLAGLACLLMVVLLGAGALWVLDGGPGPHDLFHAGAIDAVELVVMGLALVPAERAVRAVRRSGCQLADR